MPLVTGRRPIETSTRSNECVPLNSAPSIADIDLVAGVFELDDFRAQMNAGEPFAEPLFERLHQVAIGAGQQAIEQFDDRHLRAELGVDGAHFQADVSAADDQQRLRARLPAPVRRSNPSRAASRS